MNKQEWFKYLIYMMMAITVFYFVLLLTLYYVSHNYEGVKATLGVASIFGILLCLPLPLHYLYTQIVSKKMEERRIERNKQWFATVKRYGDNS